MRELERYHRYWIRKKFVTRALLIVLAALICIMALTYYGINVGTFVIQVEDNNYQSLSLSIDEERLELTDRLSCPSLDRCTDADFSYIPTDIDEGLGSKNSDKGYYFAYSFYLINSGKLALSYQMDYNLLYTSRNLEKILRVMLVVDGKTEVYAASQDSGDAEPIIVEKKDNIKIIFNTNITKLRCRHGS